jgi:hypothetical protein
MLVFYNCKKNFIQIYIYFYLMVYEIWWAQQSGEYLTTVGCALTAEDTIVVILFWLWLGLGLGLALALCLHIFLSLHDGMDIVVVLGHTFGHFLHLECVDV